VTQDLIGAKLRNDSPLRAAQRDCIQFVSKGPF